VNDMAIRAGYLVEDFNGVFHRVENVISAQKALLVNNWKTGEVTKIYISDVMNCWSEKPL
jgi:hypothetical protein